MTPLFAHIPASAHRPTRPHAASGNIGHRRGIEARVTGRRVGRSDPPARFARTAAAAGGRFPDISASALTEPAPRRPQAPRPRPGGAHSRPTSRTRKVNCLPVRSDRVHPPPSSSAPPYLRHLAMAARRRDGTGWRSLRLSPHRAEWAGRAALHPRAGRDDLLFPPPRLRTPGRDPTVPRPGRTPPSPMRPHRGGDLAAALRAPLRARGEMLISREENCDRNGFGHNRKWFSLPSRKEDDTMPPRTTEVRTLEPRSGSWEEPGPIRRRWKSSSWCPATKTFD